MSKRILILFSVLLVLAYLAGRYQAPSKIKIETKTDITKDLVINELNRQLKTRSLQVVSVTTTVQTPDGTIKTRTRTSTKDDSVESIIEAHEVKEHVVEHIVEKKVIINHQGVKLGPMVGFSTHDFTHPLIGAQFVAPVIGPLYFGAWGLTGAPIGLGFGASGLIEF